jgi:TetR/AcrR family transcriptional regulator, transcriptional repressor for nem operon
MPRNPAHVRSQLVRSATELFRRHGYAATTVDAICTQAQLTKGAFFHHFPSKEALAEACLRHWGEQTAALEADAPFQALADPVEKLLGGLDFFIGVFSQPGFLKSCLAGTAVQEVSETHPALRAAAGNCLAQGQVRLQKLLDEACASRGLTLDTTSLAALWMAALQGALVLAKASGDEVVIPRTLKHVRDYLHTLLDHNA